MRRKYHKQKVFVVILIFFGIILYFNDLSLASSSTVVINEIMVGQSGASKNEFIELYNNSNSSVDLTGWKLKKKTQSGSESNLVSSSKFIGHIPAKGYFLIAHPDYAGAIQADLAYSGSSYSISSNNTVVLYDSEDNIIDKVGYGEASDFESQAATDPANGQSITRAMAGLDTDNNSVDFAILEAPNPQNVSSNGAGEPVPPEAVCGNGNLDSGEQCDDGNNASGDGCSAGCQIEDLTPGPFPIEGEGEEEDDQVGNDTNPAPSSEEIANELVSYDLGSVVINEFVSDPADGEVEWVELYNKTIDEIDLIDWVIEEGGGAKTKLEGVIKGSGADKFFIIEKPKGNLNNKGDIIILRDSNDVLIDQVAYGNWDDGNLENNAPAASDPYSVSRKFDGQNSFNNYNDFAITTTLTKGVGNIITVISDDEDEELSQEDKAVYDYSNDVVISEILPNPEGSDNEAEFIELYNAGEREVNLTGWKLGDDSKKKYEIVNMSEFKTNGAKAIVKAGEYLTVYRKESGIALNNSKDSVKLYQPLKDEPLQIVEYEEVIEGWSFNIFDLRLPINDLVKDDNYAWSEVVTPGEENVIKKVNHPPEVYFDYPEEIFVGVPALFDSSDTIDEDEDQLEFSWDFGDGIKLNLASPAHTYLKKGAYTLKLMVSDGENEVTIEKIATVKDGDKEAKPLSTEATERSLASSTQIIINEILPNPEGTDAEGEWVEIKNSGEEKVNLLNWKLDDAEGGSKPYTFNSDIWLEAGMFYAVDRVDSGLALNNSVDAVRLFNDNNEIIDEIEYEKVIEGESYSRGENGKMFWTTVLTPGQENIISVANSKEINNIIQEPTNNSTENKTTSNNKTKQIIETTLEKIKELDSGELVKVRGVVAVKPGILGAQYFYIITPHNDFILEQTGTSTPKATSTIQAVLPPEIGGPDIEITVINPSFEDFNKVLLAANNNETAASLKDNVASGTPSNIYQPEKEMATFSPPGLEVKSAGIQIYNYKKDFPDLKVGDYIEVIGEIAVSGGEMRIKTTTINDFKIIGNGQEPFPQSLSCEKVTEENVGQLITVTGEVVERKSSIIYLDDGTNEVIIYIKTTTGIDPKTIKEGDILTITGILGRTQSGIRIMPRSSDDIIRKDIESYEGRAGQVLGEVAVSDEWEIAKRDKKLELFKYLLVIAGGVIVILGGLLIKEVRKS